MFRYLLGKLFAARRHWPEILALIISWALPVSAMAGLITVQSTGIVVSGSGDGAGHNGNAAAFSITFDPTQAVPHSPCTAGHVCYDFANSTTGFAGTTTFGAGTYNWGFNNTITGSTSWLDWTTSVMQITTKSAAPVNGGSGTMSWVIQNNFSVPIPNPIATTATATANEYSAITFGEGGGGIMADSTTNALGTNLIVSGGVALSSPNPINLGKRPTNCPVQTTKAGSNRVRAALIAPRSAAPCDYSGEPVNTSTGNMYYELVDFAAAPPLQLRFVRTYNSQDTTSSPLGNNWHSNYHHALSSTATTATVTMTDGQQVIFTKSGSSWVADADITARLAPVPPTGTQTGWALTLDDDTVENYNLSGQLTSIVTRNGLKTTLAYSLGNVTTVTGPFGQTIGFLYDGSNRVTQMNTPDAQTYKYAYDSNNNLNTVTWPDLNVLTYNYGSAYLPHAMTSITDELSNNYASWSYDALGRVTTSQLAGGIEATGFSYTTTSTTVTDARGNAHTFGFTTPFHVLVASTLTGAQDPRVGGNAFSYDTNGFIASKTDYDGNVTHYSHDSRGDELTRTEAFGVGLARTTTTTWNATWHLPTTVTEPSGRVTGYSYDGSGNLLTKTTTAGSLTRSWKFSYTTTGGLVIGATDALSNTTTYTYNANGTMATMKNALSQTTTFSTYDGAGRLQNMTDPNGLITAITYDARGRLKTYARNSETYTLSYDAAGNLKSVQRPDFTTIAYDYDNAHRLKDIKDPSGNEIAYTLDNADNLTQVQALTSTSTVTQTHTYGYDTVNRLQTSVGALGQTTTYVWDAQSNLIRVTDALSHTTTFQYDALNRVTTTIDANSGVTRFSYDNLDQILTVTDPLTLTTTYAYDGFGDTTTTMSPDAGTTVRTFDVMGHVKTSKDALANTTTYFYDALNRVTTALYTGGTSSVYTYDTGTNGKGHLTKMVDPAGTTNWTYDIVGRVLTREEIVGTIDKTITYGYSSGRISSITLPSSNLLFYSYDSAGRVTGISDSTFFATGVTFQPLGAITAWTETSGGSYTRSFDTDGRISTIVLGQTTTNTLTYGYDNANRITSLAETATGVGTKIYGYDSLNRITSLFNGTTTTSWTYDADSNRKTQVTSGTETYTYGAAGKNWLTSLSGLFSQTNTYNADGNQTGDGTHTWSYDGRGRNTSMTAMSVTTTYGISGLGQRIAKGGTGVSGGGRNLFMYDEWGHLVGEYDSTGTAIEETVFLPGPSYSPAAGYNVSTAIPIGVITSGGKFNISPDHRGAPKWINNSTEGLVWSWDPLAFGDNAPNQNPSGLGTFNYNVRFPGQYADSESGLNYNIMRDYSQNIGRYIQPDPLGLIAGVNSYGYVKAMPIARVDRFGLQAEERDPTIPPVGPYDFDPLSLEPNPNTQYYRVYTDDRGDSWIEIQDKEMEEYLKSLSDQSDAVNDFIKESNEMWEKLHHENPAGPECTILDPTGLFPDGFADPPMLSNPKQ